MLNMILTAAFVSLALLSGTATARPGCGVECADLETLQGLNLPGCTQFNATPVAASSLSIPQASINGGNKAAFCRVVGIIPYGPDGNNTLNFELWLPAKSNYDGRYVAVGNGGFAGSIDYVSMLQQLNNGHAVAGGDGGHPLSENGETKPGSYVAFFHDRSKVLTWIRDSIAMFTRPAKKLTSVYYGRSPKKMYYVGCSTGGAQGFALAQFHPRVFDGISAGCPGNWYSHLILSFLFNGVNSNRKGAFLSQDALNLISDSVIDECDAIDGVKDRVVSDPAKCPFDVTKLQCSGNQEPLVNNKTVCLTQPQIENVKEFYAGPKDSRNGKPVYPGFAPGSEGAWMFQESALYLQYGVPILQNLVFDNLSYDYTTFNWGSDVDMVDKKASPYIDHISPDLETFRKHGGKMLVTQGWADPFNSPYWPIEHREQLRGVSGDKLDDFFSLFMIPGGGHCGTSPPYPYVPSTYNTFERMVEWVEHGKVPEDLIGTQPADGSNTTVTLHPYPRPQ
ncbi:uncharacterized protein E0L32_005791 [Thyridium curvatum]|uniref:Carboxylic ester hydrolase n=1 Tax=Thyridium curvatum TaxID=1093900 RepID=A0A507B289_9PEZI|nr:uncharacterized protein E0L32_005791 [Thyridium curvatum]TPX13847.1 hypothetical protein E0L32_005791 [Thyridium curvatum]